jgi:hypothetical protein
MTRLEGDDIRGETFRDLLHRAKKVYGEVQSRLESTSPEYSKKRRKSAK